MCQSSESFFECHIFIYKISISPTQSFISGFREDLRCGEEYPLSDGSPAECDPNCDYPFCSPQNWCGVTEDHCECQGCLDFRGEPFFKVFFGHNLVQVELDELIPRITTFLKLDIVYIYSVSFLCLVT